MSVECLANPRPFVLCLIWIYQHVFFEWMKDSDYKPMLYSFHRLFACGDFKGTQFHLYFHIEVNYLSIHIFICIKSEFPLVLVPDIDILINILSEIIVTSHKKMNVSNASFKLVCILNQVNDAPLQFYRNTILFVKLRSPFKVSHLFE